MITYTKKYYHYMITIILTKKRLKSMSVQKNNKMLVLSPNMVKYL